MGTASDCLAMSGLNERLEISRQFLKEAQYRRGETKGSDGSGANAAGDAPPGVFFYVLSAQRLKQPFQNGSPGDPERMVSKRVDS